MTKFQDVTAVILGQDPYPNNKACGLAFSCAIGSAKSVKRIIENRNIRIPKKGTSVDLSPWAWREGILLLNTKLTFCKKDDDGNNQHADIGWDKITDEISRQVCKCDKPVVFLLWGGEARKKISIIQEEINKKHIQQDKAKIILSAYPAWDGKLSTMPLFMTTDSFNDTNSFYGCTICIRIDWSI
ncbi:uracil-DNA glycosylase [Ligilactobacillus sp. WC1T17]|uniref:uracil-DNA glycosylase n=1 Tax=Ligilactobacillus sp. WC1T17 TaxID=3158786 RepID=UPI0015D67452